MKKIDKDKLIESLFFLGTLLIIAAMEAILVILLVLLLITHEMGHYILAKKYRIYKGWGVLPTPHIKLKGKFPNRWGYLSGILGSLITLPLAIQIIPVWTFILAIIGMSGIDLLVFILYDKIPDDDVIRFKFPWER